MPDNEVVSQKGSFIISLAGATDSLDPILPCIADCKSIGSLAQTDNYFTDCATESKPSDGAILTELLTLSFQLFKAGQPSSLLGLLCAAQLISDNVVSSNVITSTTACVKTLAKIFVFLSTMISLNGETDVLNTYLAMAEFCIETFMDVTLSKDSFGVLADDCVFGKRGYIDENGSPIAQALAGEGVFDAMVYLFSLHVDSVPFITFTQKLITSIGSFAYGSDKMLDTFTKSGTLVEALSKKLAFEYDSKTAKNELFQLKLLCLNFVSYEM